MVIVPYICITARRASLFQETSGVQVFQYNDEAEKRQRRDVNTRHGKKLSGPYPSHNLSPWTQSRRVFQLPLLLGAKNSQSHSEDTGGGGWECGAEGGRHPLPHSRSAMKRDFQPCWERTGPSGTSGSTN